MNLPVGFKLVEGSHTAQAVGTLVGEILEPYLGITHHLICLGYVSMLRIYIYNIIYIIYKILSPFFIRFSNIIRRRMLNYFQE